MTTEENLHWLDVEIQHWEDDCQSKHPIKEALYEAHKALEQKLCKDAVSRAEVKKIAKEMYLEVANMELDAKTISDCISCTASKCREVLERKLQALPPVTPQEPNTWSLDDAREDFMHDVYNALDFLPTNEEANRIIDIFDRVTSSIEQEPRKGHWIVDKWGNISCSECGCNALYDKVYTDNSPSGKVIRIKSTFCPTCGADMREVKE